MSGNTLPRMSIIKSQKKLLDMKKTGLKKEGEYLTLLVSGSPDQSSPKEEEKFAVLVDRNIEKAVERNRLKRIARELIRLNKKSLTPPTIVRIMTSAKGRSFWEIKEDFDQLLRRLTPGPGSKKDQELDLFSTPAQDTSK